jgi:CO dehydrogenase maturation factor
LKKIAICGKGGSGKSVMTALLASAMRERGLNVLVIDADDSNTGLHRLLGFMKSPEPLIDYMGGKRKVERDIEARIKSGVRENMVNLWNKDIAISDLPANYVNSSEGISLVVVGKIFMALEGCACPLGIVSRSFLCSLKLSNNEVALVDMEAGVEHFGRGVETGVDAVLIVVEPSLDSLDIAQKIAQLSDQIKIGDVWAVINKAPSQRIADHVKDELNKRGLNSMGTIEYNAQIFENCLEGRDLLGLGKSPALRQVIDHIFP